MYTVTELNNGNKTIYMLFKLKRLSIKSTRATFQRNTAQHCWTLL